MSYFQLDSRFTIVNNINIITWLLTDMLHFSKISKPMCNRPNLYANIFRNSSFSSSKLCVNLSNSNCERFKLNYPAVNASTPLIRHFSTSSPFHCNKPLSEPIAPLSSLRLRDAFRDPKKIKHQEVLKEGYLPIYQFPYIRFCQLCCRWAEFIFFLCFLDIF